ncbi:hypothetical protein CPB84DRAFT_1847410 [Gymnopilus junonius]|uniref:Protein kinase domain-containing protein n=1 Tax=Gymnopilus junonius TaxID=109634 RepID=A0A9P5TLW9_GYMJU|nr:hypothetical protein CPB84DRAFT_1847410 [Gymnopilus junonius]
MALPQSFSTTVDSPIMETSPSIVTVRLSPSGSSTCPVMTRRVSFSAGIEGQAKARGYTDSATSPSYPRPISPPQLRSRMSPTRMSQSSSIASLLMSARSKSRSRTGTSDIVRVPLDHERTVVETATHWFGKACDMLRPWDDSDEEEIPEEQKQAFAQTSDAVGATLKRLFGVAGDVALDVLEMSIDFMDLVPVPGLQTISKTFVGIWRAVQQISTNRLAFLRLVQTCSTILDSIYKEIEGSDENVTKDLAGPVLFSKGPLSLFVAYKSQIETPFLARYLKRDDTAKAIASCNDSLMRALTLFATTVQIRTYQAVCANTRLVANMMQSPASNGLSVAFDYPAALGRHKRSSEPGLDGLPSSSSHLSLGLSASPTITSRSMDDLLSTNAIMPNLCRIQAAQNLQDADSDMEDLRALIRTVLETGNDAKLLAFLGIEPQEMPEAIKTLQRTLEKRSAISNGVVDDTLHEEFLETGIDAMRRLSARNRSKLITHTRYEVEVKQRIGMGFFSEVFQGTWKGRTVAIKVLSEATPSDLFVREIKVWKNLDHPHVLKLYGASSATGNHPWFFVSPYMRNGNLVEFLRRISHHEEPEMQGLGSIAENLPSSKSRGSYGKAFVRILKVGDVYRILHEVAQGMEYLHRMSVLHGDLKASNVLVDDSCQCVISDFGQSEMKSEVCRITGSSMQAGTLRWKAPELLDGTSSLTPATDIYAYAIVCIEVLTMGNLPWAHDDDDEVRHNILEKDKRPLIPPDFTSPLLHELVSSCWNRDPAMRSLFPEILGKLQRLRAIAGEGSDPFVPSAEGDYPLSPTGSPFCQSPRPMSPTPTPHSCYSESFDNFDGYIALPSAQEVDALQLEETHIYSAIKSHEPVRSLLGLRKNTPMSARISESDDGHDTFFSTETGSLSCTASGDIFLEARNERRYRYLLEHNFNPSLTLPLWTPTSVQLGDVGYLSKPSGAFVTLFNSLQRSKSASRSTGHLPPMTKYGNISKGHLRLDKRNVAQKGLDAFSGLLALRGRDIYISRRHSFILDAVHSSAHLYAESLEYHYLKKLDASKSWFQDNVDSVLQLYGKEHNIQKEDLHLVISLLQASNYALFVNHQHPDGHAHFNVFSTPKKGRPWGHFSTELAVPFSHNALPHEEIGPDQLYAVKTSNWNDSPKAVLLGRLRFKPDSIVPTTAK